MNRGDAQVVVLDIRVNKRLATTDDFTEIEVTFNPELKGHSIRKLMSKGDIFWDDEMQRFCFFITQEETFSLHPGDNTWQLRAMYGDVVVSTVVSTVYIGCTNSKHVLGEADD